MAEVDTSSYPKPVQSNFLDTATKFQGLAQGATNLQRSGIALEQDKLKQLNDQFQIMNSELATMANSNDTKDQAKTRLLNLAKTFGFKPQITQQMLGELEAAPNVKTFAQTALTRGMAAQEKVNNLYGVPSVYSQGQQDYPVNVSPMRGMIPTGLPIQRQIPPTQPVVDNEGRPTLQGPTPAVTPQGTVAGPGQRLPIAPLPSGPIQNPAIQGQSSNFGGNVTGATVEPPATFAERFPQPSGPSVGMSPQWQEGKKFHAEDQALATQKLTSVKPAITAANLMKDLRSGPGTETWNKAVAFMKANNIIPITANDPTAIYQEVNKYLNQYVQGGGTRSDADLAQRELSNPNVAQQISPALIKLTRNTIALDRIQAARAAAFEGSDFSQYGKYRSTFPSSVDEKAFSIDLLEPDERQKLLGDMLKKQDTKEGKKFFKSLEIAKKTGVLQ